MDGGACSLPPHHTTTTPPRFRFSGSWFHVISSHFLRDLRPVSPTMTRSPVVTSTNVVVTFVLGGWNVSYFFCTPPLSPLSLSPYLSLYSYSSASAPLPTSAYIYPLPLIPFIQIACYFQNVLLSLARYCFFVFFLDFFGSCLVYKTIFLLVVYSALFWARVCCWCIRVSLFFNANNIFFEQIFFFCFWVTLSRFCVLFKLKAQKKWKKNFLKSKADSFPKEKVRDLLILIPLSIQSSIFHSSMSFHLPYTFHQASS